MAKNSKIEWTTHTFNPWRGCTKVSPGCLHCYAETLSKRNPKLLGEWGMGKPRVLASDDMWKQPLRWNREAGEDIDEALHDFGEESYVAPERPRVFCASLADWLDEEVPVQWLVRLLGLIYLTPNMDWLLLTKRPHNWKARMGQCVSFQEHVSLGVFYSWLRGWAEGEKPHNIWVGATAENQACFNERYMPLSEIPARVRFWSMEPLLTSIDFTEVHYDFSFKRAFHWVIAGGESGPGARPMQPLWVRDIQSQCEVLDVPFLFKQWGGVNKKATGRLLDGIEHNGFPKQ